MLAVKEKQDVARPLKVLVPLIQEELKAADEAGMAHYRKAGDMLIEAKGQVEYGEWKSWLDHHFRLSQTTATIYMNMAKQENFSTLKVSSIRDFLKKTTDGESYKQSPVRPAPWHEPVKKAVATVDVERMKRALQARMEEAKLERELGFKLIDIGYKVLATKLHPDKGGSHEAMRRLNRVRDHMKRYGVCTA